MTNDIEIRFVELIRKPVKTKEEIEEMISLGSAFEKQLKILQGDLLKDLNSSGINVSSVWDLVNTSSSYGEAIPVLIKHLCYAYHEKIKEGIIRALAVKEAKGKAGKFLIDEYYKIPVEKDNLRWLIGNTMQVVITPDDAKSIFEIVRDKKNGESRQMFVQSLGKIKTKEVERELTALLDDDQVLLQAIKALSRLKSSAAKEKIQSLISHSNPLVKKEVLRYLSKFSPRD